jgi:protoporphyrinogen oxidase
MKKDNIVVIGGGLAGIFSALMYSKKKLNVVLVEKDDNLGGLLRSQILFKGMHFDFGTHFLTQTGIKELDDILFHDFDLFFFEYLKVGSFYNGLYSTNGFLSDKFIDNRKEYLNDFLNTERDYSNFKNLTEQLKFNFGTLYTEKILQPIIEKFFNSHPNNLVVDSHKLFGLNRLIIGEQKVTNILKKDSFYNEILGYHSYTEGLSEMKSMYPRKNGIGSWIEFLENKLVEAGVKIIKQDFVVGINSKNKVIDSVDLKSSTIKCDRLIWTIPLFPILKILGENSEVSSPKRMNSYIFHYVILGGYLTDLYYFQCFDPSFKSFRVTLYDNFSSNGTDNSRISVEVMLSERLILSELNSLKEEIFNELKLMGVISLNSKYIFSDYNSIFGSFPITTTEFLENTKLQFNKCLDSYRNLSIYGKGSGNSWFMNEILTQIFNDLK